MAAFVCRSPEEQLEAKTLGLASTSLEADDLDEGRDACDLDEGRDAWSCGLLAHGERPPSDMEDVRPLPLRGVAVLLALERSGEPSCASALCITSLSLLWERHCTGLAATSLDRMCPPAGTDSALNRCLPALVWAAAPLPDCNKSGSCLGLSAIACGALHICKLGLALGAAPLGGGMLDDLNFEGGADEPGTGWMLGNLSGVGDSPRDLVTQGLGGLLLAASSLNVGVL